MAITRIAAYNGTFGSSAKNITISQPGVGNRLIVIGGSKGLNLNYPSFSVTQSGVTWTSAAAYYTGSAKYLLARVFISDPQPIGASTTITITGSSNTIGVYHIAEYSQIHREPGIPSSVLAGAGSGSEGGGTNKPKTGSVSCTSGSHVYAGSITAHDGSASGQPPTYYSPTNDFSIIDQTTAGAGSQANNCKDVWLEKISTEGGTSTEVSPVSSNVEWCGVLAAFNEQAYHIITHTTNALLKKTFKSRHFTDTLLKKMQTILHTTDSLLNVLPRLHTTDASLAIVGFKSHFVDALLQGQSQLSHSTDAYLSGLVREPIYQKTFNIQAPAGINIGNYALSVLWAGGNTTIMPIITYSQPLQELTVGKNRNIQISITDPVIKDKV